jgi:hypothetical protein
MNSQLWLSSLSFPLPTEWTLEDAGSCEGKKNMRIKKKQKDMTERETIVHTMPVEVRTGPGSIPKRYVIADSLTERVRTRISSSAVPSV